MRKIFAAHTITGSNLVNPDTGEVMPIDAKFTSPFPPAHRNVVRYDCDTLHRNGVWERDILGIYSVYQKGNICIVVYRWDIYPYRLFPGPDPQAGSP